ncbi:type II secretion system protein [Patescibacteria group bacterium]
MNFFTKKKKKGFTLIELLVVIAIIGILASIVLVSVSGAQRRARDARVTAAMDQFRTQTTLLADTNNGDHASSTIVCTSASVNTSIETLCDDIDDNASGTLTVYVNDDGAGYCATVQLQGSEQHWCVDGDLVSKSYAASPATCVVGCEAGQSCTCE